MRLQYPQPQIERSGAFSFGAMMAWSKGKTSLSHDSEWKRVRKRVLERDSYLCVPCSRKQPPRVTPAAEVDHIVPRSKGGKVHDEANCESTCHACHLEKSIREQGGQPKRRIGLDGYPIET